MINILYSVLRAQGVSTHVCCFIFRNRRAFLFLRSQCLSIWVFLILSVMVALCPPEAPVLISTYDSATGFAVMHWAYARRGSETHAISSDSHSFRSLDLCPFTKAIWSSFVPIKTRLTKNEKVKSNSFDHGMTYNKKELSLSGLSLIHFIN